MNLIYLHLWSVWVQSSVERHITLDKNMYGSRPILFIGHSRVCKLVKGDIRNLELSIGSGRKAVHTKNERYPTN